MLARLSDWERFCAEWYYSHVNSFTVECGVVARALDRVELDEASQRLMLRALNAIHVAEREIQQERMNEEIERARERNRGRY